MNICLFGAASDEIGREYLEAAEAFGEALARRGHSLVFGGGATGVMGAAARGVRKAGGTMIGIAPHFFRREGVLFEDCTEFLYTETMRERKQAMEERSDAVVMAPGGIGTFEEFFEMLTLKQLGRHRKPIAVWNLCGYFDEMQRMLEKAVRLRFMAAENLTLYGCYKDGEELLRALEISSEK